MTDTAKLKAAALAAVPGHDYKAIVERIAEILHGKVTDIDLLTVTVQAMKERVKERHQMLMEDTVSRQELTRSLCDVLGVEPTYSLEALKEAIEKRGAEPWIQCSERMPEKYDRNIWLWDGDSAHCGYVWTGSSFADWNEEYMELKGVTHWMPMIVPLAPGKQPLSVEVLAGALRNAPIAPSDSQGRHREPMAVDCWCRTCRPVSIGDMRFVVCPDCGNKRCPKANDHRNSCTGSNEPGQDGSAYPAEPGKEG